MPSFDSANAGGHVSPGNSPGFSQTIGTPTLLVGLACYSGTHGHSFYTATVVIGSTSLTQLAAVDCSGSAGNGFIYLFGLIGPPAGVNTVHIDVLDGQGNSPSINFSSVVYDGVGSFGTAVTNSGSGGSASTVTVSSATGETVVALVGQNDPLTSPTGTLRVQEGWHFNMDSLIEDAPGASSVALGAAASMASPPWAAIGVALIP